MIPDAIQAHAHRAHSFHTSSMQSTADALNRRTTVEYAFKGHSGVSNIRSTPVTSTYRILYASPMLSHPFKSSAVRENIASHLSKSGVHSVFLPNHESIPLIPLHPSMIRPHHPSKFPTTLFIPNHPPSTTHPSPRLLPPSNPPSTSLPLPQNLRTSPPCPAMLIFHNTTQVQSDLSHPPANYLCNTICVASFRFGSLTAGHR